MLAERPELGIHVFYASDHSLRGSIDREFGVSVKWDVPLLNGYTSTLMNQRSRLEGFSNFFEHDRKDVNNLFKNSKFAAVLVTAYRGMLHLRTIWAANRSLVPVIYRAEDMDCTNPRRNPAKELIRSNFLKRLYRRIGAFASIGSCTRNHYVKHGVPEERIFFSPYCVDDELFERQRFRYAPYRDEIRRALGFAPSDFVFLFSGKMISKKNPLLIAQAIGLMPEDQRIGFLAVGDGVLRNELERKMRQGGRGPSAFTGFVNQSQLGKYYLAADAFILPSAYGETWGLVVNEALAFGLPVIVSDTVGCRDDLVIHERTGYIFRSDDAFSLAHYMRMLAGNRDLAYRMGQRGKELAKNYTIAEAVQGIVAAFQFVTGIGQRQCFEHMASLEGE